MRETEAFSTPVMTDNAFWTAVEQDEQCMPVTLNLMTCTVPAEKVRRYTFATALVGVLSAVLC